MHRIFNFFNKKLLLSRDYYMMIGFVLFVVVMISTISISMSYSNYLEDEKISTIEMANLLEKHIDHSIVSLNYTARYIAKKINDSINAKSKNLDPIIRDEFFINSNTAKFTGWILLNWRSKNKVEKIFKQSANLKLVNDEINSLASSKKRPWKFHYSINNLKQNFIPAFYGITDIKGVYLGSLVFAFNIQELKQYLKTLLPKSRNNLYVILDINSNLLIASDEHENNKNKINLFKNTNNKIFYDSSSGFLKDHIKINEKNYTYFRKIPNSPFVILIGSDLNVRNQEIANLVMIRVVGFIALGVFVIFILFFIKNILITPLIKLSKVAENIISQSNIDNIRIPNFSVQEFNILGNRIKELQNFIKDKISIESDLKNSKEQLELAYQEIRRINENLEEKIMKRTIELKEALMTKTEFLNNMSHEIRTPIHGLEGIAKGLIEHWNKISDTEKYLYVQQITKNASRLRLLLGHLLDLSKFSAGRILLDYQEFNLNTLVFELIDESETLFILEKSISIDFKANKEYIITADRERIAQVLRNLLSNSIKFSPPNSVIKVLLESEIKKEKEYVAVSVIDQGIGIPENELNLIFEPFAQSSRTKSKAGGTGLGLAICHEIIEAHAGEINVINNKELSGAVFKFVIPVLPKASVKLSADLSNDIQIDAGNKRKILIIDDEDACLTSMELILKNSEYNLIKANGGIEALKFLENQEVDLILLDLMMPDMYGINVLEKLKSSPRLSSIPVIIQSGTSDEQEIIKAMEKGAIAFLRKPYQKSRIFNMLESIFQKDKVSTT